MSTIHYLPLDSLSTKAQLLAKQRHRKVLLQLFAENESAPPNRMTGHVQLCGEGPTSFTLATRVVIPAQFFAKPFELVDGKPPEAIIEATLDAYGRLVDAGLIDHAVMLPPCWISLAPPTGLQALNARRQGLLDVKPDEAKAYDMIPEWIALSYQRRQPSPSQGAMLFFVFGALPWMLALDYPRKYMGRDQLFLHDLLNEALGTDAFGLEGRLSSPDWSALLPDPHAPCAETLRKLAFDPAFGDRARDHKRGTYSSCLCPA